jgi:RHS repeat-associated protein
MGNRVVKIVKEKNENGQLKPSNEWKYTYYIRDPQGNVIAVYERNKKSSIAPTSEFAFVDELKVSEHHIYGSSRLGSNYPDKITSHASYNLTGDSYLYEPLPTTALAFSDPNRTLGNKKYELTNHLSNILVVITDMKYPSPTASCADLTLATDYYPFGSAMPGRSFSEGEYRFGFNGMEGDNEISGDGNSCDFGARMYDARLGRWLSVDPLANDYPSSSTYSFVLSNPILFIDPNGKEVLAYTAKDRNLVLLALTYAFGDENGFSFEGNKLVHNGQIPNNLSDGQKIMFDFFQNTVLSSQTPTTIFGDRVAADYYNTDERIHEIDNFGNAAARTIYTEGKVVRERGLKGLNILNSIAYSTDPSQQISISYAATNENTYLSIFGLTAPPKEGMMGRRSGFLTKEFSPAHVLLHEFGHAILNTIIFEMDGKFNGIDFNKLTPQERSDWAIRFTNTLLESKGENLESGAGQHGDIAPRTESLQPIDK